MILDKVLTELREKGEYWRGDSRIWLEDGRVYGDYPSQLAYDALRFIFQRYSKDKITELEILELGGGYGRNAVFLSNWGLNVTLADFSKVALGLARALNPINGVKLVAEDVSNLSYKNEFDISYSKH